MLLDIFFLFIQFSRCSLSRTVSSLSGFPKISPRQTSQITSERLPRLPSSFFLRAASRCVCKHHACAGGLNTRVTLCLFGLCASRINPAHFRVLVGLSGLEPPTSRLSGVRSNRLSYKPIWSSAVQLSLTALGGDKRDRTVDLLLAKQALSQLSYTPNYLVVHSGVLPSFISS